MPLATAIVGKCAFDEMTAAMKLGVDCAEPEATRNRALQYLTKSANYGVAASAAALGQLYYRDAMARQKIDEETPAALVNDDGNAICSNAVVDALNLARNWFISAVQEKGDYRLTDEERAGVLAIPYVSSVIGTNRFDHQ